MFFVLPDLRELSLRKPQGLRARDPAVVGTSFPQLPMYAFNGGSESEHPKAHTFLVFFDSNPFCCHLQMRGLG
jgi:hypothetical protein